MIKYRSADALARLAVYLGLVVMTIVALFPVLWMIFDSLKSNAEFYANIWSYPRNPMWQNYALAWQRGQIGERLLNSVIVTTGTLAIALPAASMAAYAVTRLQFRGRRLLFYFFMLGMMIPNGVTAIPILSVIIDLGLVNTRLSLILVLAAQALAFDIFIMHAFFISLPSELEEAALIDGCTPLTAFWRVILPLASPGLATIAILTGLDTWNEFLLTSILVRSADLETLPLGLVNFVGRATQAYPQMFAYLAMITVPVMILYLIAQKRFISGLTAGAVKG